MPELLKWLVWILATFGGICLLGLVFVGGFIFKKLRKVKGLFSQIIKPEGTPAARILDGIPDFGSFWNRIPEPDWDAPEQVARYHEELETLHFERLGFFAPTAKYEPQAIYVFPAQRVAAWLSEHDEQEGRIDITVASWCDSGVPITVTTADDSGFEILLPGEIRQFRPAFTPFQLCEELIKYRQGKNLLEVTSENVTSLMERTEEQRAFEFAADREKQEEWRKYYRQPVSEGGPDSVDDGEWNPEATVEDAFENALHECLTDCCLVSFARSGGLTPEQLMKMRDRLLVVHDRVGPWAMMEFATEENEESIEELQRKGVTFREAFEEINRGNPPYSQWKRLGEVADPIEAEVYLAS